MRRVQTSVGLLGLILALYAGPGRLAAQELGPPPTKEHEWLKQFVGEWEVEGEANFGPDTPKIQCQGSEKVEAVGGYWISSRLSSKVMGSEMVGLMTVGYDPAKKKYIGTWLDSHGSHLWKYEGAVDATGKILTLEAEGPNMLKPGKMAKFRDSTEFKSADHRILSSAMQGEDGKWVTFMTMHFKRKK